MLVVYGWISAMPCPAEFLRGSGLAIVRHGIVQCGGNQALHQTAARASTLVANRESSAAAIGELTV